MTPLRGYLRWGVLLNANSAQNEGGASPAASFSIHTNKCPPNFVTNGKQGGFLREDPTVGLSGASFPSSGVSNSRNPKLEFQQFATSFRLSPTILSII